MPDQQQTLEYERREPRHPLPRFASVLSIVIGVAVTITCVFCVLSVGGDGPVSYFFGEFAYDRYGALFLPPLTIIGILAATIARIKSRSVSAIIGIALCVIAFFASMLVSAIYLYFRWGWWR